MVSRRFGCVKALCSHIRARFSLRRLLWIAASCAAASVCVISASEASSGEVEFNRDVLPILAENCFACHGFDSKSREADLRLDTREEATKDRGGVVAVLPGDPESSELIARVTAEDDDLVMPPRETGKQLSAADRDLLYRWIEEGAVYEPHWAFVAPRAISPPIVDSASHPIDCFIQAELAEEGLQAAPTADAETLIRRVSLDLIGLPPTADEVDAFIQSHRVDPRRAWVELVDRLLSSPHYGERWARWWLDQARYADSNGYSIDAPRSIWLYRDWVIESLNADLPFDQFTIEQLAGDLLPGATTHQKIATGFHRNTQINQEGGIDKEQFRIDSVFDRVATTGTVWFGLTIGCAQCHDHKFDPITQQDFYRLFAFFNNQDEPTIKVFPPDIDVDAVTSQIHDVERDLKQWMTDQASAFSQWESDLDDETRSKLAATLQKALKETPDRRNFDQQLSLFLAGPGGADERFRSLAARRDSLSEILATAPTTMVLSERSQPRSTHVLVKGDFTRPAEEVSAGTPSVLHPFDGSNRSANRLDLARWIVHPDNPLTARVIVNRLWQQYFGRGLVATENDFGLVGERPTHPELLDWLASELIARRWSLKSMHRLIVTSHTYRQSSRVASEDTRGDQAKAFLMDPDNELLARQSRLRLDAEVVRDAILTASGLLAPKLFGSPVFPPIPDGVMGQGQVKRAWNASEGEDRYRRGLYTFLYRATPPPSLTVFDAPDGFSTCTRRNRSNTPLQSLTLMNDDAFFECALSLEQIVQREGVREAFRRCTGRYPDEDELNVLERLDPLTVARAMLNLDETITRE